MQYTLAVLVDKRCTTVRQQLHVSSVPVKGSMMNRAVAIFTGQINIDSAAQCIQNLGKRISVGSCCEGVEAVAAVPRKRAVVNIRHERLQHFKADRIRHVDRRQLLLITLEHGVTGMLTLVQEQLNCEECV